MPQLVASVYDQDLHVMNQATIDAAAMDAPPIPSNPMLATYPSDMIPVQPFDNALGVPGYIVKSEIQPDMANAMQVVANDPSGMYMAVPLLPMDPVNVMSPAYPTEVLPPPVFAPMPPDPAMAMQLNSAPLTAFSTLSTPSPPALPNSPTMLGSIQVAPSSYSVATTSSLDSALINMPLSSPTRMAHSVSPISVPSPFGSSSSQSPPGTLALPTHEGQESLKVEASKAKRRDVVLSAIDSMLHDLYAARAVAMDDNTTRESQEFIISQKMALISRMAANMNLNSSKDTALPPPPPISHPPPSISAFQQDTPMACVSDLFPNFNATAFDASAPLLSIAGDGSRKRNASEMDQERPAILKREPQEDVQLALSSDISTSPPASFPALAAIPFSSQLPLSRPPTRPSTPQTFQAGASTFGAAPLAHFVVGAPSNMVMSNAINPLHVVPSMALNPSFSSVPRTSWPEPSVSSSRHHHSYSAGSPMHIPMPQMMPMSPRLASGPTTPITINPPILTRTSRSGSLSNIYDVPFASAFHQDMPSEPPLKKAALGTRSARSSTVGSNWYFGNDGSSPPGSSEEPNTARNSPSSDEDEDDNTDSENDRQSNNGSVRAVYSNPTAGSSISSDIPQEYCADVDRIFFEYLNAICSNLDATDSKGDHIHQTLMAKKMQRLDESPDFRPFKFRIQAFTAAFLEELARQGYPEDKIPMKKVRNYLWHQPHILRFNEDGKKAKSKGNHIWNVEARKSGDSRWEFRPFHRKIAGSVPSIAYCGLKWTWTPRIWDPQSSFNNVPVTYSSPILPPWLSWKDDVLSGTPSTESESCTISVIAKVRSKLWSIY